MSAFESWVSISSIDDASAIYIVLSEIESSIPSETAFTPTMIGGDVISGYMAFDTVLAGAKQHLLQLFQLHKQSLPDTRGRN